MTDEVAQPLKTATLICPYCEACKAIIDHQQSGVVLQGMMAVVDTVTSRAEPIDFGSSLGLPNKRQAYHWKCFITAMKKLIDASRQASGKNLPVNVDIEDL